MLHALGFEDELNKLKETSELLDELWQRYMVEPGANYNDDWRKVLQKLSDLIGAIEDEQEEYEYCRKERENIQGGEW